MLLAGSKVGMLLESWDVAGKLGWCWKVGMLLESWDVAGKLGCCWKVPGL
jgi:hypothetical protein